MPSIRESTAFSEPSMWSNERFSIIKTTIWRKLSSPEGIGSHFNHEDLWGRSRKAQWQSIERREQPQYLKMCVFQKTESAQVCARNLVRNQTQIGTRGARSQTRA